MTEYQGQQLTDPIKAHFDGGTWHRDDGGKWPDLYDFAYTREITGFLHAGNKVRH